MFYDKAIVQLLKEISKKLDDQEKTRQRDALNLQRQTETMVGLQRALLIRPDNIFTFHHEDQEIRFYFPNASYETLQLKILQMANFYEAHLLAKVKHLIKDAAVLDVGANIGNHSIYFSKIAGARSVTAFEPQRQVYKMLERNVALNDLKNVTTHNVAVGAKAGTAAIGNTRSKALGTANFTDGEGYTVRSIDEMAVPVDFLKIDVEGYHLHVLNGALNTLAEKAPVVWIELREVHGEFPAADSILKKLNYVPKKLDANNFLYRKA
jgi:FkbM family methyltransferase